MKKTSPELRIPCATYRLQFNRDFTFGDARRLIDYLNELGITDIYSSPVFLAPPESNHGYDVCDYNQFNPVLGNIADWNDLSASLKSADMGLLLDFVPNHMAANVSLNPWWRDVLEYGIESPYSTYFDINWDCADPSLHHRVGLPVLEDHCGRVLKSGLITLAFKGGSFWFEYRGNFWPLNPASYRDCLNLAKKHAPGENWRGLGNVIALLPRRPGRIDRKKFIEARRLLSQSNLRDAIAKGVARFNQHFQKTGNFDELHVLLEQQAYRLSYWKSGTRIANYRRFFNVDSLVAVNMDRAEVFTAAHSLLFKCLRKGQITGLRIDHVDGLADPAGYLEKLQKHIGGSRLARSPGFYVVVEKITMHNEHLPRPWPVHGTTGYDFAAQVSALLADSRKAEDLDSIYNSVVGNRMSFSEIETQSKRQVMDTMLEREFDQLTDLLVNESRNNRDAQDLIRRDLKAALIAIIAACPVYRTYLSPGEPAGREDRNVVEKAINAARRATPATDPLAFDFIKGLLLMPPRKGPAPASAGEIFRVHFPQVTGAVMAKGREDTAYFVYNRLVALDEVGGDPQSPGTGPAAFHAANAWRLKHYPHSMLTTSTHDTKMSEDARARALAISEIPSLWRNFLEHAMAANLPHKTMVNGQLAPDKNEEYRFYQILLATWPLDKMPSRSRRLYVQRIQQHMLKSLREEKVHTFWSAPKADWEKATENFVFKVINQPGPEFRAHFQALAKKIAQLGMVNSLSQTLLKLTVPGVPDIFQGNEIWQFLLTDPDNRRPVDFANRQKILASLAHESPESLLSNWQTGAIKLFVTRAVLRYRKDHRLLFQRGKYSPLEFSGPHKDNCVGFARQHGKDLLLVFAPRLTSDIGFPPAGRLWGRTRLKTRGFDRRIFRDIFTERVIHGTELKLATIFADLPVAVLAAEQN